MGTAKPAFPLQANSARSPVDVAEFSRGSFSDFSSRRLITHLYKVNIKAFHVSLYIVERKLF